MSLLGGRELCVDLLPKIYLAFRAYFEAFRI